MPYSKAAPSEAQSASSCSDCQNARLPPTKSCMQAMLFGPGPSRPSAVSPVTSMDCQDCETTEVCEEAGCMDHLTENCTEECVVVQCDEPHIPHCESHATWDGRPDSCHKPFACCEQYADLADRPVTSVKELDAVLCQCGYGPLHPHPHHCDIGHWNSEFFRFHPATDSTNTNTLALLSNQHQHSHNHENCGSSPSVAHEIRQITPTFEPTIRSFTDVPSAAAQPPTNVSDSAPASGMHMCMWAQCGRLFHDLSSLVGHVNVDHLQLGQAGGGGSRTMPTPITTPLLAPSMPIDMDMSGFNLGLVPDQPMNFPPDVTSISQDFSWETSTNHSTELQSNDTSSPPLTTPPMLLGHASAATDKGLSSSGTSVTTSAQQVSPNQAWTGFAPASMGSSSQATLLCQWDSCTSTFTSAALLDAHVDEAHIGSGRAHYDCRWAGCTRHGPAHGFASRQKVKRHIQSHTGHRPHMCDMCGQSFSEAATLQQHVRRHKLEKPYKCDHPGCEKAFTVAGALTIHKRTHTGSKPFQCTTCGKAFAESSNLSKHMRTHTGARPYKCEICEKTFARPDQLSRHVTGVHKQDVPAVACARIDPTVEVQVLS